MGIRPKSAGKLVKQIAANLAATVKSRASFVTPQLVNDVLLSIDHMVAD
jgi:hypothetical protein